MLQDAYFLGDCTQLGTRVAHRPAVNKHGMAM
jgi:hypothetical protein